MAELATERPNWQLPILLQAITRLQILAAFSKWFLAFSQVVREFADQLFGIHFLSYRNL